MPDPELERRLLARARAIPISATLGMELVGFDEGTCAARVPYRKEYDGVFESFHGGILMTIADSVACFAVLTLTGAEQALTTTDMNIRFLRPCLSDVTATARVIKRGRTMCPVSVELNDAHGELVAIAQVNYMLLPDLPRR
ncbi:MAG: PaaI family thioesterase [Planctomycetes bacterium]|nr:PaaI family thioesterase [Planctomycetota bacterium]